MKVLYCQLCGDIVAPWPVANKARYCDCGAHAVWWVDPNAGTLRVCCTLGHPQVVKELEGRPFGEPKAYVLGITNALLHFPGGRTPTAEEVQELIEAHPDSYIFKQTRSLIIRIRPGQSGDTAWAPLPVDEEPENVFAETLAHIRGIAYSCASFIAAIDSDSTNVAEYLLQRLEPLKLMAKRNGRFLNRILEDIGQDGRQLQRGEKPADGR